MGPKSNNMVMLTALSALLGEQFDHTTPFPCKKGCRNGKPFNDGFDDERIMKAQEKRLRKQAKRLLVS